MPLTSTVAPAGTAGTAKPDAVLASETTVELARGAAVDIAEPGTVGEHLGLVMVEERVGTHLFACTSAAYPGWRWAVTVARVSRAKTATVSEAALQPGDGALLAPEWVPYAARLAPGDLSPGDVLPFREQDPLLEAGFEATGDQDVDQLALWDLGLGRARVLSPEGREVAAQRWYDGSHGPFSDLAVKAPAHCTTCGYFVPMAGALRQAFGVCANEWSPSDGQVVSLDHGCGAHSEADVATPEAELLAPPIVDDYSFEPLSRSASERS